MEHSNRSLRDLNPVYDNDTDYTVTKSKVSKESLYLEGVKKSQTAETPTPTYDAGKIASIIQAFLDW